MAQVQQKLTDVKDSVLNGGLTKSGEEPPSGVQGKGTIDEPYDQGNAPETAAGPGIEPPSGQKGSGTIDSPYDKGNAPGKDIIDTLLLPSSLAASDILDLEINITEPSTTHQGSGLPQAEPNAAEASAIQSSTSALEATQKSDASMTTKSTGVAADGGNFDAAAPGAGEEATRELAPAPKKTDTERGRFNQPASGLQNMERDISPGQLDDGTHVQTSGDKGESYAPGKLSLNKIKGKLHIGKH